jgi:biotin carboxylase
VKRLAMIGVPPRAHYRRLMTRLAGLGYRVVTLDAAPSGPFDGVVEASIQLPGLRQEPVDAALAGYHRDRPIDGVALFHELTVEISSRGAASLGLPHFPLDRIAACTDKLRMRRWMAESGVPCPPFAGVSGFREAAAQCEGIGYPVVIKPVRGGASYGVTRLDDRAGLERFFAGTDIFWEPREFIVERYLPGHEVSVETIVNGDGGHSHVAVFDKPQALDGPYFLEEMFITTGPRPDPRWDDVRAAVSLMVERLGLRSCVTHTELRLTAGGPVVLEFGLRPIGWPGPLCVQAAGGGDLIEAMAAVACGQEPGPAAGPGPGAAGWRYLTVPAPGVITALPDPVSLEREGALDVSVWAQVGDTVGVPPRDFNYIKGYLAAAGPAPDSVSRALSTPRWAMATSPGD